MEQVTLATHIQNSNKLLCISSHMASRYTGKWYVWGNCCRSVWTQEKNLFSPIRLQYGYEYN